MKKIIATIGLILLLSGIAVASDPDYPPKVPDKPPEYKDGLKA